MNLIENSKEYLKKRIVPFIIGPTGIGKTKLSVLIAKKLPVEIISADSRQIYKYLNIGTAKPSQKILSSIPHHLIDCLEPDEYFSAGKYSRLGRKLINQIFERNKIPIIVGGSGLYVKALIEGFFDLDVRDDKIRQALRKRLMTEGTEILYQELQQHDPELAAKIKLNDKQRILRGLEVFLTTGKKLSELQEQPSVSPDFQSIIYGLKCERKLLYDRINTRVDEMITDGLLIEVVNLKKKGYTPELNSLNTVGYKEVFAYLDNTISYDEMVELIKRNTRHYAKRQMTWFNKNELIIWKDITEETDFQALADHIVEDYWHKNTVI